MSSHLPLYDDLPPAPRGGRLGWHVFGEGDERGTINLLTEQRVREAAQLVKRGVSFSLDHPVGHFDPPIFPGRQSVQHHVADVAGGLAMDDYYDAYYPQGGSQWDSLAHVGYDTDAFYNGATVQSIRHGRNSIRNWAERGIVGRGVVVDMPAHYAETGVNYSPGEAFAISAEDVVAAIARQGVDRAEGDILVLYTGFDRWYEQLSRSERAEFPQQRTIAGLERSEETVRHLWNTRVAAIVSDNLAVEASPGDFTADAMPFGFMHQMLIGSLGFGLGELWRLGGLVDDCRESGVYEGLLVSAPTGAPGGIGSAANAIFMK